MFIRRSVISKLLVVCGEQKSWIFFSDTSSSKNHWEHHKMKVSVPGESSCFFTKSPISCYFHVHFGFTVSVVNWSKKKRKHILVSMVCTVTENMFSLVDCLFHKLCKNKFSYSNVEAWQSTTVLSAVFSLILFQALAHSSWLCVHCSPNVEAQDTCTPAAWTWSLFLLMPLLSPS